MNSTPAPILGFGSIVEQVDELNFDEMELSPINTIFKNRSSNFEYHPDRSLRKQLTKIGEEKSQKDSPGPFKSLNKIPSPGYNERHSSKSKSIANVKASSFEEFQGTISRKKLDKSILEEIPEQPERDPKNFYSRMPSMMSSI